MLTENSCKIIECPRDAMQGWPRYIPAQKKSEYLSLLLKAGFDTLDCGSFVSAKAIPQMKDTAEVLSTLDFEHSGTALLAIVANKRGAVDALSFGQISYLGFPFSISETFQRKNTNSSIDESFERVKEIQELCIAKNRQMVVYLSMAFGNPYGDKYDPTQLIYWASKMRDIGIKTISLADTVGIADPGSIYNTTSLAIKSLKDIELGIHLHATPATATQKFEAAFFAGCRRFDGALKGIGGCPMAQDELVGNLPTELIIKFMEEKGISHGLNLDIIDKCLHLAEKIFI